jgi:Flp pilus assembly protein TadG
VSRFNHGRRLERGQSLVEFALVFPIFMLLLFGFVDIGRYVYITNAFNQGAREAARYGSVEQWSYSCPASVPVGSQDRLTCTQQVAKDRIAGAPAYYSATATCTTNGTTSVSAAACRAGYLLKVIVQTPSTPASQSFSFFTPVIGNMIGPVVITGQAQVVVQ